jgi:hypothetical protein
MSNNNNAELQAGKLIVNNYAPFNVVSTIFVSGIGDITFGINGEVIFHDKKIACYGALTPELKEEVRQAGCLGNALKALKVLGDYRVVTHVTLKEVK